MAKANVKSPTQTPMMRQYLEIKSQNEDAILFYRLGDFYEMFYDDAITASQILEVTLTARNKNSDDPIPMCGVPFHAAENYIAKLIQKGKKVAICEQVEDASQSKGLVKRGVTRVLTPGTVLEDQSLAAKTNNFILTLNKDKTSFQAALCDITTGKLECFALQNANELQDELARQPIREFLYPESLRDNAELKKVQERFPNLYQQALSDLYFDKDFSADKIKTFYKISEANSLSIDEAALQPLGALLSYLDENKILQDGLLEQPKTRFLQNHLTLDETTLTHLELFNVQGTGNSQGSLFWHLDQCVTAMGSRKLSETLLLPLLQKEAIEARLAAVENLLQDTSLLSDLTQALQEVYDVERIVNKFISNRANPRDAIALKNSIEQSVTIKALIQNNATPLLQNLQKQIQNFSVLREKIETTLVEEPPINFKDGGVIADGVHQELDELRAIEKNGKSYILQMEAKEKESTGITSLKIRYNNVFGYYIEVTHTHIDKVPAHYVRKQTLTNAERYITDELKQYESKVLGASERIKILEADIFASLRSEIAKHGEDLKTMAQSLAFLDVLQAFANLSKKFDYQKPNITDEILLDLKNARHPIIERMNLGEPYIPNDIFLDASATSEMIITGPNMAGKSTVMRMTALITLMAQIGCFVPAESATIGICDRIFTRVGAHDSLQKGMSTFMVEMVETAKIVREATPKSLIILDEIGRGTSTFDGLSIAWAVAEDLHDRLKARTLFATHYHELCDLADHKKGIANFHMQVKNYKDQIIFLRKLIAGGTNRSLGVAVAQMAGLPAPLVKRSKEILKLLEKKDLSFNAEFNKTDQDQISLFETAPAQNPHPVIERIKTFDINQTTPLEALSLLSELKDQTLDHE